MGKSVGPPDVLPDGRVTYERSGSVVTIEQRGAGMVHRLLERGLTAEYPIEYQVGAGKLARSYIVINNGYLFESPATWFRAYGWDASPGYSRAAAVDFDRPINETCLFCHAGAARFSDADGRKLSSDGLTAITCERCHGPWEDHVRRPTAKNIVNPARLEPRARDSVCEQCHLEGAVRILNPGKTWRNFHPGEDLERTAAVYVFEENGHEVDPVSQIEQLAASRCAAASGGKLWCGSCHKVHGANTDRVREIREVCASCHAALSKVEHPVPEADCVSCHMPRLSTGYTHVAVTNHRIPRRPNGSMETKAGAPKKLTAWVNPPVQFRQRDLMLANLLAGNRLGQAALRHAGLSVFDALTDSQREADAAALAGACEATLDEKLLKKAVEVCRLAMEQEPASADRAMSLGIALDRAGELEEAERELKKAIRLDPSLKHAYVELWTLYDAQKKTREMAETGDLFLRWNPQNVMFRVLKEALAGEARGLVKEQ